MDKFEDIFSHNTNEELEQVSETPEVEEIETTETVTGESAPETVAAEVEAPAKIEPKMVPLSAVQAERQRVKDAIDQANALRQQLAALEANKREVPDPYDDPQAFYAHNQELIAQQVQQALIAQRFNESQARAVTAHGQDFVNEVADWAAEVAASDPSFETRVFAQTDPAAWVIEQYKRSELLKSFEDDPDEFVRRRALELGLAAVAETEAPQSMAKKPLGPKSLVSAKSRDVASNLPSTPEEAFDAIFRK